MSTKKRAAKAKPRSKPKAKRADPKARAAVEAEPVVNAAPVVDERLAGVNAAGRPIVYSPEVVDALTEALGNGLNHEQACAVANISDSSFRRWRKLAQEGDPTFDGFLAALTRAKAQGIQARLQIVKRAGEEGFETTETVEIVEQKLNKDGDVVTLTKTTTTTRQVPPDWRAAWQVVERVASEQFGIQKHEITGKGGGPIQTQAIDSAVERIYGVKVEPTEKEEL